MAVHSRQPITKLTDHNRATPLNIALWTTYDIANTIFSMEIVADTSGKRKPWTILFGALTILFTAMVFLLSNVYRAIAAWLSCTYWALL